MQEFFKKARPIFAIENTAEPVVSCGYRADFNAEADHETFYMNITCRSFYRLYINGQIAAHGPARTAHGYLRVDELDIAPYIRKGVNHIAIEQISYADAYGGYSNDITLENGIMLFEIRSESGEVVSYSSKDTPCVLLASRHRKTERKSHCREATEIWDIDENYDLWRTADTESPCFSSSYEIKEEYKLLPRRMLYPELKKETNAFLSEFGTFDMSGEYEPTFYEKPIMDTINGYKDHVLKDLMRIREHAGNTEVTFVPGGVSLQVKENAFLSYDLAESFVGFTGFHVKTDSDIRIDVVTTELQKTDGSVMYEFNEGSRLYIKKGEYSFAGFDAVLGRYIRLYITGNANVTITDVHMLTYSYPDKREGYFMCSDDNVNRLYMAARKTLILNTLDVFMDCPDRERGGWLCDSFWTARAAAIMLGDTSVEKAFIENFLLTDPKKYHYAFFPSVYPGNEPGYPAHEISTWSFWLLAEICEYVKRTGDIDFVKEHKARIDSFIEGALSLRGESGLLEALPIIFIDWSQANRYENIRPINTAANALFAFALREYGKMMNESSYIDIADKISSILKKAVLPVAKAIGKIPDSITYENGVFKDNGYYSEAAHFTSMWSELLSEEKAIRNVVDKMGPAPKYRPHPDIGKSGLFIGHCIRTDMLAKLGEIDTMFDELCAIYYPQLKEGPGTLWENEVIETSSRCHGFSAHAGYLLTRHVLGIDIPDETSKHFVLTPNPVGLRWARGVVKTRSGEAASVSFVYENGHFTYNVVLPKGYTCEVKLPACVKGLGEENIEIRIV